jgi:hypothetical protein
MNRLLPYIILLIFASAVIGCGDITQSETQVNNRENPQGVIMTISSSIEPCENTILNGREFQVVTNNNGDTTYWQTTDTNFISPEGFNVGLKWNKLPNKLRAGAKKMTGWGFYINLESGWQLGFCEGETSTDSELTNESKVKWIFKRQN